MRSANFYSRASGWLADNKKGPHTWARQGYERGRCTPKVALI